MSGIILKSYSPVSYISVPSAFITDYMPKANGEYIKIYLYILKAFTLNEPISLESGADFLDTSERDLIRALRYWEKAGLLSLTFSDGEITEIILKEPWMHSSDAESSFDSAPKENISARPAVSDSPANISDSRPGISDSRPDSSNNHHGISDNRPNVAESQPGVSASRPAASAAPSSESIKELALTAEQYKEAEACPEFAMFEGLIHAYLKVEINPIDYEHVVSMFLRCGKNFELLDTLTEYCGENLKGSQKKNLFFLEGLVNECVEQSITTIEAAKKFLDSKNKHYMMVMKEFGITNRDLGESEKEFLNKWFRIYNMSDDLVKEACRRTMLNGKGPSFPYADGILKSWFENRVTTLKQVEVMDSAHKRETFRANAQKKATYSSNKFNNFETRKDSDSFSDETLEAYTRSVLAAAGQTDETNSNQ